MSNQPWLLQTDIQSAPGILQRFDSHVRLANADDAEAIAPLFYEIWEDMGVTDLAKTPEQKDLLLASVAKGVREDRGRFGYSRVTVYVDDSQQIQAALASFLAEDEDALGTDTVECILEMGVDFPKGNPGNEAKPGSYYLDSLCVNPNLRGKGIGSILLREQMMLCAFRTRPLSLIVDDANPNAQALYERLGFTVGGEQVVFGHMYHSMTYTPEQAKRDYADFLDQERSFNG